MENSHMKALVLGTITFKTQDCPSKVLECLCNDLSFHNPEYTKRLHLGLYLRNTPELIECFVLKNDLIKDSLIEIPSGAIDLLKQRLNDDNISISFTDNRQTLAYLGLKANVKLRSYQLDAVAQLRKGVQGTLVMPCGSGKTITAIALMAAVDQPTLVIVHTHDLLVQWKDNIKRILSIDAGIISEGKLNPGSISIATVQTLCRMHQNDFIALAAKYGCVILDEAHHVPAYTFQKVVSHIPAKYRYGLTATPERDDGLTPLIGFTFGNELFRIGYPELIAEGYLKAPEVSSVFTNFKYNYSSPDVYQNLMSALVENPVRNALIANLAISDVKAEHTVLILSGRVEHCKKLIQLINSQGIKAGLLVGSVSKKKRQTVLDEFRTGKTLVIAASSIADEGLDIPCLNRIIFAFPTKAKGRTTQRLGRLMRPYPGKHKAILYDIVDRYVPVLVRQYYERKKIYKELGLRLITNAQG